MWKESAFCYRKIAKAIKNGSGIRSFYASHSIAEANSFAFYRYHHHKAALTAIKLTHTRTASPLQNVKNTLNSQLSCKSNTVLSHPYFYTNVFGIQNQSLHTSAPFNNHEKLQPSKPVVEIVSNRADSETKTKVHENATLESSVDSSFHAIKTENGLSTPEMAASDASQLKSNTVLEKGEQEVTSQVKEAERNTNETIETAQDSATSFWTFKSICLAIILSIFSSALGFSLYFCDFQIGKTEYFIWECIRSIFKRFDPPLESVSNSSIAAALHPDTLAEAATFFSQMDDDKENGFTRNDALEFLNDNFEISVDSNLCRQFIRQGLGADLKQKRYSGCSLGEFCKLLSDITHWQDYPDEKPKTKTEKILESLRSIKEKATKQLQSCGQHVDYNVTSLNDRDLVEKLSQNTDGCHLVSKDHMALSNKNDCVPPINQNSFELKLLQKLQTLNEATPQGSISLDMKNRGNQLIKHEFFNPVTKNNTKMRQEEKTELSEYESIEMDNIGRRRLHQEMLEAKARRVLSPAEEEKYNNNFKIMQQNEEKLKELLVESDSKNS